MHASRPQRLTWSQRYTAWAAARARDLARVPPHTPVLGLGRTLLATSTLVTLLATPLDRLFYPSAQFPSGMNCAGLGKGGLFCLLGPDRLGLAVLVAVAVLGAAASGWRPRLTAVPHWWVCFSLANSSTLVDGGDHVAADLSLLLLPLALTDHRRWHWQAPPGRPAGAGAVVAHVGLRLVWVQAAVIYLHSALAKLGVTEWADGTALWYWTQNPIFGAPPWLDGPLRAAFSNGVVVAAATWGTIAIEFLLAWALLLTRRGRWLALGLGLALHAAIVPVLGLLSFSLVMTGVLVIYLVRPGDRLPAWRWPPLPVPGLVPPRAHARDRQPVGAWPSGPAERRPGVS